MDTDGATGGAKRVRAGPTFTNDQEMSIIIDFVNEPPELYTKEMLC